MYDEPTGCHCHLNPPCSYCMSLTEEEVSIHDELGEKGVADYRAAMENGAPWPPLPEYHDHPKFGRF